MCQASRIRPTFDPLLYSSYCMNPSLADASLQSCYHCCPIWSHKSSDRNHGWLAARAASFGSTTAHPVSFQWFCRLHCSPYRVLLNHRKPTMLPWQGTRLLDYLLQR